MGKAEMGSTKQISNQMKSRGLTKLNFYCQVCGKATRDANSFKQHTMSESHVRNLLIVGENQAAFLKDFSDQFVRDFVSLLKTSHGEKSVHANHFYQEYIAKKDHLHLNATKWNSLTEFVKHLGRESICRVEETEKGLHIAWIDNSPEALRRQETLRRKALQDQGDEELETRLIREQIKRAQAAKGEKETEALDDEKERGLKREEGEKIKLSFGAKPAPKVEPAKVDDTQTSPEDKPAEKGAEKSADKPNPLAGFSMKAGAKPQTKNVFAAAKKNKPKVSIEQPKRISEAERIMKEEMERKRSRDFSSSSGRGAKRQKTDSFQR